MTKRVRDSAASLYWMGGLTLALAFIALAVGVVGGVIVIANKSSVHDGGTIGAALIGGGVTQFAVLGVVGFWAQTYAATVLDR
jgi:hypothetical protein